VERLQPYARRQGWALPVEHFYRDDGWSGARLDRPALHRMRRGRLAALRAGRLLPWSVPPYAYRLDPRRPRDPAGVRVEAAEAALVRRIFRWHVEGCLTLYAIARRLTREGTPSPTSRPYWGESSVRTIIVDPAYHGTASGNR
jgi:site-specific DNA recombinase